MTLRFDIWDVLDESLSVTFKKTAQAGRSDEAKVTILFYLAPGFSKAAMLLAS